MDFKTQSCTVPALKKPITTTAIAAIEAKFKELDEKILADITKEIGAWMITQGFDPKRSFLVLPTARRSELPQWPPFVRFSPYIDTPILMRDMVGLL